VKYPGEIDEDSAMKCPMCGCRRFYLKDPDDQFETYPFELINGDVSFDPEVEEPDAPDLNEKTETFCEKCAWHGPLKEMGK
jgi:hypothetical protein